MRIKRYRILRTRRYQSRGVQWGEMNILFGPYPECSQGRSRMCVALPFPAGMRDFHSMSCPVKIPARERIREASSRPWHWS